MQCSLQQYWWATEVQPGLQRRCCRSCLNDSLLSPNVQLCRHKNAIQHSKEKEKWTKRCNVGPLMFTDQLHTMSMLLGDPKSKLRYVIATLCDGNKAGHVWTAHPLLQTPLFFCTPLFLWPMIDRGTSVAPCLLKPRFFQVLNSFKVAREFHSITYDVYSLAKSLYCLRLIIHVGCTVYGDHSSWNVLPQTQLYPVVESQTRSLHLC